MELKQSFFKVDSLMDLLLIVPYGIETKINFTAKVGELTFNRTLWN